MGQNKQKDLKRVFEAEFSLNKLESFLKERYQGTSEVTTISCQNSAVTALQQIKIEGAPSLILVVELVGAVEWDFAIRRVIANYLEEKSKNQALVALYNPEQEEWYWTMVVKQKSSLYCLYCYSIPVGQVLTELTLQQLNDSLDTKQLEELTDGFRVELIEQFVDCCQDYCSQLEEKLSDLQSEGELAVDLARAEVAQQVVIKLVVFYLFEQRDLVRIELGRQLENDLDIYLKDLSQLKILDFFMVGERELLVPAQLEVLNEFVEQLEDYNLVTIEDQPWQRIWAVGPAVIASLNQELLSTSQRKNTGVFYTPHAIVHYMSQETISDFLVTEIEALTYDQAKNLIKERELVDFKRELVPIVYRTLDQLKACDPAGGSGAFALGLAKEIVRIKEVLINLAGDQVASKELKAITAQEAIYAMDIDRTAVEITKLRLWLWTEQNDLLSLADLEYNLVVTNPLLKIERSLAQRDQDLKQARDNYYQQTSLEERYQYKGRFEQIKRDKLAQEFSLVDYFPTVFQQGGFDLVIGNPPYIGEKGNKDMFRELKKYALRDFYSGKMDLFYFFFHLGLDIVKEGGQVALITTDYYLTATGAYKLRTDLEERGIIRRLIDFNNTRLFPAAMGQHNLITIVKKNTTANQSTLAKTTITNREGDASRRTILDILAGEDKQSNYYSIPQKLLYQGSEKYLQLEVGAIDELLTKIKVQGQQLGEICSVNQGIVSGCDRVSPRHIRNYDLADELKGRGIFVVDEAEVAELDLQGADKELLRPWFKNSDIEQYWCRSRNKGEYLLYLDQELKELPASIADYFAPVEEILQSRREVEADRLAWWQLQWPRCAEIFAGAKLVVPQRSKQNTFAYTEKPWYASADVYYITQPQAEIDLKYILALLNSKLYFLWFYYKGKKKGKLLELYQRPLTRVPIKPVSSAKQQIFIDLVEQIQTNKQELLEKKQISLQTIQSEFELTGQTALQTIVSNSKHYKQHYQGQASIVRNFKLEIDDDLMIVYSAKSSEGYYKLFEFELADSLLQNYLQIYLENLTDQQLAEINQAEISTLVERVLAIKIPSYHKTDQVQVLMDRWQNIEQKITNLQTEINELQEEIDYLVYQLYQFSTDEIDCLTEQYAKIKDY